jgi:DNA-binding response OmpR family regulator
MAKSLLEKLTPELLILDLLLTKEDGSEGIMDKLKSEERLKNVVVLVLTNLDKPELKQMLLSQGVKEYIIKGSLSLDELYEKVMGYLEPKGK